MRQVAGRSRSARVVIGAAVLLSVQTPAMAQNFASPGANWSSSWGFASPADRSLSLQQAQAIRQAQMEPQPGTLVTNTTNNTTYNNINNDSRSNYQEVLGDTLDLGSVDFQLNGDRIGQNTNAIGSMNTGTTNVEVNGNSNEIIATNAAENEGCIDGAIEQNSAGFSSMASPSGIDISSRMGGRAKHCVRR
ncbi:hypothetical protein EAT49_19705 [Histidinibacterium lentulum]|uniref:Uncharacterized protein n=2 Tax=Histidinibacterium lentulum TaxID=2480588 RepID=A0A3N2QL31_9RHOB|nr:hypothetical protein EAT49_19705 [Histidinibacterium lentulum]